MPQKLGYVGVDMVIDIGIDDDIGVGTSVGICVRSRAYYARDGGATKYIRKGDVDIRCYSGV